MPMLAIVTAVVRKWELLPISFKMENICGLLVRTRPFSHITEATHVLMTCIRENNDRKAAQDSDRTFRLSDPDHTSIRLSVAFDEMREN